VENNYGAEPIATPPASETFKKSSLPLGLVIMGATALVFPLYMTYLILPQLSGLVENLGGGPNGFLLFIPIMLVVSLFIAVLFYGIHLLRLQKRQGGLNAIQHKLALNFFIFGIIAGIIAIPALIFSIVSPIYSIINSFN
jgi:hypothetical protein